MTKRVLDVGQCDPDHASLRRLIQDNFSGQMDRAHGPADTLSLLRQSHYDLVLINRKLDRDHSDGLEILRAIKADPQLAAVPVMLITNFPEHQQAAMAEGGILGFGKAELDRPETAQKLQQALESGPASDRDP